MSTVLHRQNPELFAQDDLFRLLNVDPSKKNHPELDVEAVREIVRDYPKIFLVKNRFAYGEYVRKLLPIFNLVALQAPADVVEAAYAANPFSIMDELDSSAQSVVHYACRYHAPLDTLEFLCTVNVTSLQLRDAQGYTPLHTAVMCRAPIENITYLMKRNPDAVRIPDKTGNTPVHWACKVNAPLDVIQALVNSLKKPAEYGVLVTNDDGWTPLHFAAANVNTELEVMEFLIETAPSATEMKTNPPVKEPKKEKDEEGEDEENDDDDEEEEEEPEGELPLDMARNNKADAEVIRLLVKSTPGATFRAGERHAKSKRKMEADKKKKEANDKSAKQEKSTGVEQARDEDSPEHDDDDDDDDDDDGHRSSWLCCSRRKQKSSEDDEDDDDDEEEDDDEEHVEQHKETAKEKA